MKTHLKRADFPFENLSEGEMEEVMATYADALRHFSDLDRDECKRQARLTLIGQYPWMEDAFGLMGRGGTPSDRKTMAHRIRGKMSGVVGAVYVDTAPSSNTAERDSQEPLSVVETLRLWFTENDELQAHYKEVAFFLGCSQSAIYSAIKTLEKEGFDIDKDDQGHRVVLGRPAPEVDHAALEALATLEEKRRRLEEEINALSQKLAVLA